MHHSHAPVVAEDAVKSSPTPWFWWSGQVVDPFEFTATKGAKKPKKQSFHKHGSAQRRVLAALSGFAALNGESWPSVPTMARIAECSERTVQRILRKLCGDHGPLRVVGRSGEKYKNTTVYALSSSATMSPNVDIDKSISSFYSSNVYKPAHGTLLCEQGTDTAEAHKAEQEKKEEQTTTPPKLPEGSIDKEAKPNPLTPAGFGPSPNCAAPLPKPWPVALTCAKYQQALMAEALGKRDSKLVKLWKTENKKAGFGVHTVSSTEGAQLKQLARGEAALPYVEVLKIIPVVIAHWTAYTGFCRMQGVHYQSKAKFPAEPSTGFLLRYKHLAKEFYDKLMEDEALPPEKSFLKNFLWSCIHHGKPKAGPLSKKIPAPRLPKRWRSPIWSGHPLEHKKLSQEEMHAPSTWNATTEAETLAKMLEKGIPKDHAMAVMKYAKHDWDDFFYSVKIETGADIHVNAHPHLVLEHWSIAKTAFQEWWDQPKKGKYLSADAMIASAFLVIGADFVPWWSPEEEEEAPLKLNKKNIFATEKPETMTFVKAPGFKVACS